MLIRWLACWIRVGLSGVEPWGSGLHPRAPPKHCLAFVAALHSSTDMSEQTRGENTRPVDTAVETHPEIGQQGPRSGNCQVRLDLTPVTLLELPENTHVYPCVNYPLSVTGAQNDNCVIQSWLLMQGLSAIILNLSFFSCARDMRWCYQFSCEVDVVIIIGYRDDSLQILLIGY